MTGKTWATACFFLLVGTLHAEAMEIAPLAVGNQSPLVQLFALPDYTDPGLLSAGHWGIGATEDIANDFAVSGSGRDSVILDGETYRSNLRISYGLSDRFEAGIELPVLYSSGGVLDDSIIAWHSTFGFPQGGRTQAPRNQLLFSYRSGGVQRLLVTHANFGAGDATLDGAMRLADRRAGDLHLQLAARATLGLPTGQADDLRGSGASTEAAFLTGSVNLATAWGEFGAFGSIGDAYLGHGQVLSGMQNTTVPFGTAGIGWSPARWWSLTTQLDWNAPLFHGTDLPELGRDAMALVTDATFALPRDWRLALGFTEDVAVDTAPDIAFNLGLSRQF